MRARISQSAPVRGAHERGAALVIALILMLALTVIGISGMNTATLELTMAGNTQAAQDAFQAAENGIDIAIESRNWSTTAPTPATFDSDGDGTAEADAVTEFAACTGVPDSAFSTGEGTGSVMAWHFDVTSTGVGARNATSTHDQSFYVAGPAC